MIEQQHASIKNGAVNHHTPEDAIYLKPIRLGCNLCNHTTKVRGNLWQLHLHYLFQHRTANFQETEAMLIKLIREGVLK